MDDIADGAGGGLAAPAEVDELPRMADSTDREDAEVMPPASASALAFAWASSTALGSGLGGAFDAALALSCASSTARGRGRCGRSAGGFPSAPALDSGLSGPADG